MTKEEVLKAMRNHLGDIKHILIGIDSDVYTVAKGVCSEPENFIGILKSRLDDIKSLADTAKGILDEWPEE